ncbi:MAG: calcium-binding protein [Gaiellaceae bacterium]
MLLLTLASPAGAKRIVGNRGSNTLIGTAQRDVILTRAGHDTVSGGGAADSIYGQEGNDVLLGDAGNDSIWGGGLTDTILGGSGRDTIRGEWGADVVDAGSGNDLVLMDTDDGDIDSVDCGGGIDRAVVRPGDRYINCESVRRLRGRRTPAGTLRRGTAGPDDMSSSDGGKWNDRTYVLGLGGDDIIWGWGEADILWGHHGRDTLQGNTGRDWLLGGPHNDTLTETGGGGLDRMWAGPGEDDLFGGDDEDELIAIERDNAVDHVNCGMGNDRAVVRRQDVVEHCERVVRLPGM